MGFSKDNLKGFVLALLSSGFIGASFIIKKKGLRRAAAASGVRAGDFLFTYFFSISVFLLPILVLSDGVFFLLLIGLLLILDCCRLWRVLLSLGASMVAGLYYK